MDLRQLRYFVAVARERNFTRAAATLHIAQPPLSRQIQLLEDELGVELVIRSSRPIRLTEAGRVFYEQALQILGRVEQMKEATRRVGLNQNSVLSIGFVASTLYGGLPALVRKLRHQAPDLDIQLLEMMSVHQLSALKEGRIDIGFGRLRHTDAQVVTTVLREERLAVAIPRDTPLAFTSDPILPEALAGEKLILYPREPRPSFADQVLSVLLEQDVRPAEIQEVTEIQTALGLVAAEAGVCVVPSSARKLRSDVHYRLLAGERATSPVVLSQRISDSSPYVKLVGRLALEMQKDNGSSSDLWSDTPS